MVIVFVKFTVDPALREQVDQAIADLNARTVDERRRATKFEYLSDPADPSKVCWFQCWPDRESWHEWMANETHREVAALLHERYVLAQDATPYEAELIEFPPRGN